MIFLTEQLLKDNKKFLNLIDSEINLINNLLKSQKDLKNLLLEYMQELATTTTINPKNSEKILKVLLSYRNSLELAKTNITNLETLLNLFNDIKKMDSEKILSTMPELNSSILNTNENISKNEQEILQILKMALSSTTQDSSNKNNKTEEENKSETNITNLVSSLETTNNENLSTEASSNDNVSNENTTVETTTNNIVENSSTSDNTQDTTTKENTAEETNSQTNNNTEDVKVETENQDNNNTEDAKVEIELQDNNNTEVAKAEAETQDNNNAEDVKTEVEAQDNNNTEVAKVEIELQDNNTTVEDVKAETVSQNTKSNSSAVAEPISIQENTLIISEKTKKVFLPYSFSSLETLFKNNPSKYSCVEDIIRKDFTMPLDLFKIPSVSRFRESFKLMRDKENKSFKESFDLAIELFFNYNLHPAIISACRNLDELDIYLDYLSDNETHKFNCFNIVFEVAPTTISKHSMKRKLY